MPTNGGSDMQTDGTMDPDHAAREAMGAKIATAILGSFAELKKQEHADSIKEMGAKEAPWIYLAPVVEKGIELLKSRGEIDSMAGAVTFAYMLGLSAGVNKTAQIMKQMAAIGGIVDG